MLVIHFRLADDLVISDLPAQDEFPCEDRTVTLVSKSPDLTLTSPVQEFRSSRNHPVGLHPALPVRI
jgi:hypothetical protein